MGATRFRAYQLGNPGSSFTYAHDGRLTLIEGRLTRQSLATVGREVLRHGAVQVSQLHITSWDLDHCDPRELADILDTFDVKHIEYPGYPPHTESAREAWRLIANHPSTQAWSPTEIARLPGAPMSARSDVLYWPREISDSCGNDNSTVKLFRHGDFTVLSLGDVQSPAIARRLLQCPILTSEVDVMILAHHGADNGFTSKELLEAIRPTVAICSSDYDNRFEHPCDEIRDLLYECEIPIYTTKTGDVLIESMPGHLYQVTNLIGDNTEVSSTKVFAAKRSLLRAA